MESLLYSFFIESNTNSLVSYQRIKKFLSNIHIQNKQNRNELSSLYKLINYGVIDYAGENKFYLTPSIIINAEIYKIGVNLPSDIIEINQNNIIYQNTGITIFNSQEIFLDNWDIKIIDYKFDNYISNFPNIFKIPTYWMVVAFPNKFLKIEKFDPENLNWYKTEMPISSNSLYKLYTFSNDFYEYYFYYNKNWYQLGMADFDKVNLSKTILALKNKIEYNISQNILSIPFTFPLPSYISKLLFLNHCLSQGKFPENRKYIIEKKEFKKINKVVFNDNIKIIANE